MAGGAFRLHGEGQRELLHVSDEVWIAAPRPRVAAAVAEPGLWARVWPGLTPTLRAARGLDGVRLTVVEAPGGPGAGWHGSAELYLREEFEGTLLFHFLRLDPGHGHRVGARGVRREQQRRSTPALRACWALKDDLEGRGTPTPR